MELPSLAEIEEHHLTHDPCRDWVAFCVGNLEESLYKREMSEDSQCDVVPAELSGHLESLMKTPLQDLKSMLKLHNLSCDGDRKQMCVRLLKQIKYGDRGVGQ